MIRTIVILFAVLLFAPNFTQARDYTFPVAGAPFRAGARVLRGAARLALAPARLANKVRVNSLERRASRGNRMAAARLENTQARMKARGC